MQMADRVNGPDDFIREYGDDAMGDVFANAFDPADKSVNRDPAQAATGDYQPNGATPDEPFIPPQKHWPEDWPSGWPKPDDLPEDWPRPMGQAAFHGPAGDFVRLALPETEADPHALLICLLVAVGCAMGRTPHHMINVTRHGTNLFTLLVGRTSEGRKGTAANQALEMIRLIDSDFMDKRVRSGLSSGQGLTYYVRDERWDDVEIKEKGKSTWDYRIVDKGVTDKRLLVPEEEFSSALKQFEIPGNTLSPTMRKGFDGTELATTARSNHDRCKTPHISVIAEITPDELNKHLTATEKANGLVNRFLACCCHRYQRKPYGGDAPDPNQLKSVVDRLKKALEQSAKMVNPITLDRVSRDGYPSAYDAWQEVYSVLTESTGGMFGEMTARGPTLVLRLAMIYAVLDCSDMILLPHLKAAQEVWLYCERSVRYLFGDALGDETADAILRMLRDAPDGLTKTEISAKFGRNKDKKELDRALNVLLKCKRAVPEKVTDTGGGPAELWRTI
jgi:hypothetical protein